MVKTYELPSNKANKSKETSGEASNSGAAAAVRQGVKRMGTWTGVGKNPADAPSRPKPSSHNTDGMLARMGNWGFKGPNTSDDTPEKGKASAHDAEEDDRQIRFTIGGAGRRLTKEDFLNEMRSLDPKARLEVVASSDAPDVMKDLARRDASKDNPGSSRLFAAQSTQVATGKGAAKSVGAEMARKRGADVDEEDEDAEDRSSGSQERRREKRTEKPKPARRPSHSEAPSKDVGETQAERRRREQALKGVDHVTPAQRGRSRETVDEEDEDEDEDEEVGETAAEKRRRVAALGRSKDGEDSDEDGAPRVPPPVAKSRGIRFAQSPVRGGKPGRS